MRDDAIETEFLPAEKRNGATGMMAESGRLRLVLHEEAAREYIENSLIR